MNENIDLQRIVRRLGIDVPVVATRLIGDQLELFLYGGRSLTLYLSQLDPDLRPEAAGGPVKPGRQAVKAPSGSKKPAARPKPKQGTA